MSRRKKIASDRSPLSRSHEALLPLLLPGAGETIVALATPPGRGALAVMRLSGSQSHAIAGRVLTPWRAEPCSAYLATLRDSVSDTVIDHPVVTVYVAPRSYTGEDLVELSLHGGEVVSALALAALLAAGAREALPGEFTRRAVANGKMDILQAEGVGDLIDAQSRGMHDAAIGQLEGSLSRRIAALRDAVIALEALIAYEIDFPEEDDGPIPVEQVERGIAELLAALDALLATAATGEVIRRGALVVITGAPNAGKSSLFNALLGSTRAIVTNIPGTTRDAIEAVADVEAWPVRLVDTAGLRETIDVVERLGIEVSERYLSGADMVLACGETEETLSLAAQRVRALTDAPVLEVLTKSDLVAGSYKVPAAGDVRTDGQSVDARSNAGRNNVRMNERVIASATTGAGLGELAQAMARLLAERFGPRSGEGGGGDTATDRADRADRSDRSDRADRPDRPDRSDRSDRPARVTPLLTRERHRVAVQSAREEVAAFHSAWRGASLPASVAAVHLHAAATALESLIGGVDVEDVLDRIFSDFCVGK